MLDGEMQKQPEPPKPIEERKSEPQIVMSTAPPERKQEPAQKPATFVQRVKAGASRVYRGGVGAVSSLRSRIARRGERVDGRPRTQMELRAGGARMVAYTPGAEPKSGGFADKTKQRAYEAGLKAREISIKAKQKAAEAKQKAAMVGERVRKKAFETGQKIGERAAKSRTIAEVKKGVTEAKEEYQVAAGRGAKGLLMLPLTKWREAREQRGRGKGGWMTPTVASIQADRARKVSGGWGQGIGGWGGGRGVRTMKPPTIKMPFFRVPGAAQGRQPRFSIPKGLIKPYFSKKLKKALRTNIRKFGVEEGVSRTKEAARLQGWKGWNQIEG